MMDFNKIALLLAIEEKVRNQPNLKPIWDEVLKELMDIANPPVEADTSTAPTGDQ